MSTSARQRAAFECVECGHRAPKWAGRCDACGDWNTVVEMPSPTPVAGVGAVRPPAAAMSIVDVVPAGEATRSTTIGELDRVLGGGLVEGSVTLVGGEPGVGKSTLLLQALGGVAAAGSDVLYLTAEESAQQVRQRAERVGALSERLWLASETSLPAILGHLDEVMPSVVVIDSIQALGDPVLSSAPGSVGQVRHCANALVRHAKQAGCAVLLVGHVTKDGALAGPRVLEHAVDTVLSFEGDRHHALRLLRAVKHRFGSTHEIGLLSMASHGLDAVTDPSEMFLADRRRGWSGSVVVPVLEGRRPILVEVQALVAPSAGHSRRSAQGVDSGRLELLLAVLERRAGLSLAGADVFATAVGGFRVSEPAADLAMAVAIASTLRGVAVRHDVVVCGEVGLGGEVRAVQGLERRVAEAGRLGFGTAVVPESSPAFETGIELVRVPTVARCLDAARLWDPFPHPGAESARRT